MNLNLAGQLLASLGSGQVLLGDHFEGPGGCLVLLSLYRLNPLHLVALCEASFAEEATSAVADDLARLVVIFWIHGLHLLLDGLDGKMIGVKMNDQKLAENNVIIDLPLDSCNYRCG